MTQTADTLLLNGHILTLDSTSSIQQAVAMRGARIQAVGRDEEVRALVGPDTRSIDLQGHTVIPGIVDTHAHMDREGLKNMLPGLEGVRSIADILAVIKREVARQRPGQWIVTMPIGDRPNYADMPGERRSGAVIGPQQCLTRLQALRAFTMGGAYFCGVETQRGSLQVGKLADLAVLSDDPLQVPEERLPDLQAHLTLVGGRVVYDGGVLGA